MIPAGGDVSAVDDVCVRAPFAAWHAWHLDRGGAPAQANRSPRPRRIDDDTALGDLELAGGHQPARGPAHPLHVGGVDVAEDGAAGL